VRGLLALAVFLVVLRSIDLLVLGEIELRLFLRLQLRNLLSFLLLAHVGVVLQQSDLFLQLFHLFVVLFFEPFDGLDLAHPFLEHFVREFDGVVGSDEAAAEELVGIAFEHALKVNEILLGLLLLFFLFLLLALLHEVEHLVVGVLLDVFLEVHDGFVLGERADTADHFLLLVGQNVQNAEGGLGDVLLPHFRQLVDARQSLESQFFAFFEQEEEGGAGVELQQEGVSFENVDDALQLSPVLDSRVRENHFSLEAAVLAADLEFIGYYLKHLQVRVLPAN
jgi:hypothetical protein